MKLDNEAIGLIVAIIGQLGAWVTIILIFLTLKEMENQRKESNRPVIAIPKFGLQAEGKKAGNYWLFDDFHRGGSLDYAVREYSDSKQTKQSNDQGYGFLVIYNLGVGAAKDIEVKWRLEFDLKETIERIKDIYSRNSIPVDIDVVDEGIKIQEKSNIKDNISHIYLFPNQTEHIDFLLPHSIQPSGIKIILPLMYQKIITLFASIHEGENEEKTIMNLPILIEIHFRDIANNKYTNLFRIKLGHCFTIIDLSGKNNTFETLFETFQLR